MKLVSLMLLSISAGAASLANGTANIHGVWVNYETRLDPPSPPIHKFGGGILTERDTVIKRHICNFDNNTYFGYDLSVDSLPDNRYRMVFAPLTMPPRQMTDLFKEVINWTPLPLPGGPVTMEVKAGETVALDLFVNPSTGQKVTDYLSIKSNREIMVGLNDAAQVARVPIQGEPHDFSIEDATIQIYSPRVSVDGKEVAVSHAGAGGQSAWVDIPGHGRFIFSLFARLDLGMQKAGEIRGNEMTWRINGHDYQITTDREIAWGRRPYNLYVFHSPREIEKFLVGGGIKLEDLIRAH